MTHTLRALTHPLGQRASSMAVPKAIAITVKLSLLVGLAFLTQTTGIAQQSTLSYSRGFLVTGDYAVGGVDLREGTHAIVDGFSTAPISINGVPTNADIIAAYLYWETVTSAGPDGDAWKTEAAGVKFRGFDLDVTNPLSVKRTGQPSASARCFGSGSLLMHMFRADVLRFLPVKVDSAGKPTGKRVVNDGDLSAQSLSPHTVTLPVRDGNAIPESAGASLVIIYRDPSPDLVLNPLKKILIYEGNVIKPGIDTSIDLTIKGFYGSSTDRSARITHIVSSGQPNSNLQMSFTGAAGDGITIASDPFTSGPASQRWWANPTQAVSSVMAPDGNNGPYGETVTTSIFHAPSNGSYDCLASGAVVFSTAVEDDDVDGLPDALERAPAPLPLLDADGTSLPNLFAMGAGDHGDGNRKDLFIEVNAMRAEPGTTYGSLQAPYPGSTTPNKDKVDALGHHHMPTPYVLRLVGDAFAAHDIRVHFDVGDTRSGSPYRSLGIIEHPDFVDDYASGEANQYLIDWTLARGGEVITEAACNPGTSGAPKAACHFPDYPGAVPWKLGLQAHRDAPVDAATGNELADVSSWDGERRRFDPERRGLFKYLLYAHSRGNPKSLPCLVDGVPSPYLDQGVDIDGQGPDTDTPSCLGMDNPDFDADGYHVPTSASGIAELPGGNFMVTLGFWDEFIGRPFVRASTTFHELGHTLGLLHGGPETELTDQSGSWQPAAVTWGDSTMPTVAESNCKPNYFSSMSYLFQVHGLFDDTDQIHLDYSWTPRATIDEQALFDGSLFAPVASTPRYQAAWFAPSASALAARLGVQKAKRFCNGERFNPNTPEPLMSRVFAELSDAVVDWNGDDLLNDANGQDVNFDNDADARDLLRGFSDWANLRLNQTGAFATGIAGGSAEGVFFDNSGVFFDQSGVFFDQSGVWFDNAGGVFFDNSGVFFDNAGGVWFDNSGVWFDNAGGVWFDNAGGVFFDQSGVFFDQSGVWFDQAGGVFFDNSGQELTYEDAKSFGRGRPHKIATCVVDEQANKLVSQQPDPRVCSTAPANDATYHGIEVQFEQLQVGGVDAYEIDRKSADAQPNTPEFEFATVGTVAAHLVRFTDSTELANGVEYTYRVRGLATDEFGNSGWSRSVTEVAVNAPPVAQADGPFEVAGGTTLHVAAPGVLANDSEDVDSPPTSRRLQNVTSGPSHGVLSWNADGSFSYTPSPGYVGSDSFTYVADNGAWSGNPAVPLSPPSNEAMVSITVTQPPTYGFVNVQNLPPSKSSKTGSTIPLRWRWTSGGVAINTAGQAIVKAYACDTKGVVLPGALIGSFDPSRPGSGNSFQFDASTNTWAFNWKLQYVDGGVIKNLPVGTYVAQIINSVTSQVDPNLAPCKSGPSIKGALITVVK